jgi:maltose O-acetyltransferase
MPENFHIGQKAKMLAGEPYIATDPELSAAHLGAQAILAKFNTSSAEAEEERRALLKELFGRIGEGTVVKPTLRCDYGFNISIGHRTFINYDCLLLDCNRIAIGDEVQIAPGVHI